MNRRLSVEPDNLCFTAESSMTVEEFNEGLRSHGLYFSIDLGANTTLGGMAGTNASGSNPLRYGNIREQVLVMEIVPSDSQTIRVDGKARKPSIGYDLKDLLIDSEIP